MREREYTHYLKLRLIEESHAILEHFFSLSLLI